MTDAPVKWHAELISTMQLNWRWREKNEKVIKSVRKSMFYRLQMRASIYDWVSRMRPENCAVGNPAICVLKNSELSNFSWAERTLKTSVFHGRAKRFLIMKLIEYKMDREAGRARWSGSLWCCEIAGRKKLPKKLYIEIIVEWSWWVKRRQMIIERFSGWDSI